MRSSISGSIFVFIISLCTAHTAHAADPQPYKVDLASTGDGAMDATLRATSELVSLRDSAPVGPFGLIGRARAEVDRLKTVLESYGFYQSAVTINIEGMALNGAGLADALNALPKGRNARVSISFALGPLYHLRKVGIEGTVPASAVGAFLLKSGAPAVAAEVLAAGARLQSTLQEQGYAFATVDPPIAYEDQTLPVLDVSFTVHSGAQVNIGEIRLEGLQRVHEKLVRRRLTLHSGERYRSSGVEAARRDLLSLGPFAAVSVQVGAAVDASGGVPITFVIAERKRHAVTVNAAYSSDLGGSGGVNWSDRNVFGNAEQLNIAVRVLDLGGSDTTGLGYDTTAKFTTPDFGHRDQSLQIAVGAIRQSLQAYDQTAVTTAITLSRKLTSTWTTSAGVATSNERIIQEGVAYNYTLLALPLTVSYDSTHLASPLDDPLHGMRDSVTVTPTQSLGRPNASFIVSQVKFAAYFDLQHIGLTEPGRSVVAVRALAALAQGAGEFSLPPDQRFYGGGSGSIRGYRYQSVGPQFCVGTRVPVPGVPCVTDGNPIGGTALTAGTVEFRRRFGANFGAAVFIDGGQVSASLKPLPSDLRFGAGVGARYYTPIGPIRFDLAVPTHRESGDDAFEVYIGLGQAF